MPARFAIHSRGGAYVALAVLTIVWSVNWIALKVALASAHPVVFNVQRTWVAVAVLFGVLLARRGTFWPTSWRAALVTALFQTTINFGATTMALANGGAGRTSVLVFTMPFWTLLIAWPVLHERLRGSQWLAVALALGGLAWVVEPWHWQGDLAPKLWAILSGFGWAAGTVCMKYYSRQRPFDMLSFIAWQTFLGVLPLTLLVIVVPYPGTMWSLQEAALLLWVGGVATALGFLVWMQVVHRLPAGTASLNIFAIPVIALVLSRIVFDERLTANEWLGIGCLGLGLVVLTAHALRLREASSAAVVPLQGD